MVASVPRSRRQIRRRHAALLAGVALLVSATITVPASAARNGARHRITTPSVTYFSLTKKIRDPFWITAGPDGNMWFTNPNGDTIGRITPRGVVTEFQLAKDTHPQTITAGADGNLWFTMRVQDKIGVMDVRGHLLHQYATNLPDAEPYSIAPSPDGVVWYTDSSTSSEDVLDKVERMTLDGNTVEDFDLAQCACGPIGAAYGPDGNMWFTEELGATPEMNGSAFGTVDRVSLDGKTIDRFAPSVEHATLPQFLTPGPDGNVWFTEVSGEQHSIGRVTPAGDITEFKVAETNASTNGIAAGADGDIWFTEAGFGGSDVWRVHPDGSFVGTAIPVHPTPVGLAVGPDGNLWFASRLDGEIGRIGAAPAARGFVLEIASGFAPALRTVSLGRLVQWVMEAPGTHRVRDATGMGLYDSGPVDPVSFATFRFPAAGRYPYADGPGHRRGAVAVGMDGPATADLGSPAHLRWATAGAPDGMVFDVQVQRPGSDRFTAFRTATPSHGTTFTPALAGSWRFRARMHPSGQPGTGYSPVRVVHVG